VATGSFEKQTETLNDHMRRIEQLSDSLKKNFQSHSDIEAMIESLRQRTLQDFREIDTKLLKTSKLEKQIEKTELEVKNCYGDLIRLRKDFEASNQDIKTWKISTHEE